MSVETPAQTVEFGAHREAPRELHRRGRGTEEETSMQEQPTAVPYGFCQCGCGQRTKPCAQTVTALGLVRGEPRKFVVGHNGRGTRAWNRGSDVDYIVDENGCWVWQLRLDRAGYAVAHVNSHPVRAARLFYERHVGPILAGLQIDHLCRVTACVNPAHLEPVTPAENVRRRPATKITLEIARAIRAAPDERGVDLARRFGISQQQVCNIRKGRAWSDA